MSRSLRAVVSGTLLVMLMHAGAAAEDRPDVPGSGNAGTTQRDPKVLTTQALKLYASGNYAAALPIASDAVGRLRAQGGENSPELAWALVIQGLCHKRLRHFAEAEAAYRAAIEIYDHAQGSHDQDLAIAVDNLASLYVEQGRLKQAEPLRLRALQIFRGLDPGSPDVGIALQNLAALYVALDRLPEAETLFLEALDIATKTAGTSPSQIAGVIADNLAGVYRSQRKYPQAETYYLKSISAFEAALGPDHPDTALAFQNYAILLADTGQYERSEGNLKHALAINERLYGETHTSVAAALNTLVVQYISQQRWPDALTAARRAAAISTDLLRFGKGDIPTEGGQDGSPFRRLVQAAYGAGASDPALMNEAYMAAQRALETDAALALSQLAVRYAAGDGDLARLLRERQDLAQEAGQRDRLLVSAVALPREQRDSQGEDVLKARLKEISGRVAEIDLTLGRSFPQYATLSKPTPVSIAETQALLQPDEALVQFLDLQEIEEIPETAFAWLITKTDARWARLPIGTRAISRAVGTLRCGLDVTAWQDSGGKNVCRDILKLTPPAPDAPLPFDVTAAYDLYQALLAPFATALQGKHMMVVPSGSLTRLPLSVLVTQKPDETLSKAPDVYRRVAWLGTAQPISILPSVASLQALRLYAKHSHADRPFLGIGNPLLDGAAGDTADADLARQARARQACPKDDRSMLVRVAGLVQNIRQQGPLFRGGRLADISAVREMSPLPETADELCAIARSLGVADTHRDVLLGSGATETRLKALSSDGTLEHYQVLQFATHGVLPDEAAAYLRAATEPGLILTPPTDASSLDDGLLTASEITELKLNADWVVLSACNTAARSADSTEALSGLARAFFYAGTRSLLVSHWQVGSDAAVKLTTKAFAEMKARSRIGRAEALRVSMKALVETGPPSQSHPSQWAPFVVVGEGGR